jgi:hypothetical protein
VPEQHPPKAEIAVTVDAAQVPQPVREALAAPVKAQRMTGVHAGQLESEKVVIAAPLSYAGSAGRLWKLTGVTDNMPARVGLGLLALLLIAFAWLVVTGWYVFFGLLLLPYRLIRRGQRKRKRESLQHREMIAAIKDRDPA